MVVVQLVAEGQPLLGQRIGDEAAGFLAVFGAQRVTEIASAGELEERPEIAREAS